MRILFVLSGLAVIASLTSCGGSKNHGCFPSNSPSNQFPDSVTISGTITYEHVPNASDSSLDFDNASTRPAKGITVQAIGSNCSLQSEATTNALGEYAITVPASTDVFIRAKAEIKNSDGASWEISIRDNTSGNRQYVLDGSTINTGTDNGIRNLHASSGWTGFSYTGARNAAPFAILDAVYEVIEFVREVESDIQLPTLQIRWSSKNLPVSGDVSDGEIGTSYYESQNVAIYLLGSASSGDTDEYDRSVVQHEFGHYLEDQISRSDSIGGPHGQSALLDSRLAFSEGFGNALTAMATGTGFYYDSIFSTFNSGLVISLETSSTSNPGWYSEDSSGQILYDIFDGNDDGADTISLGFAPIYYALTSNSYINGQAQVNIFSFLAAIEQHTGSADFAIIQAIAADHQVHSTNAFGVGETNDGGSNIVLPIYRSMSPGDSIEVCSDNDGDPPNGFDVHRLVTFTVDTEGVHSITASKVSGNGDRDPDFVVFRAGESVETFESSLSNTESGQLSLPAGDYVLDFYDYNNVGLSKESTQSGLACFTLSINTL